MRGRVWAVAMVSRAVAVCALVLVASAPPAVAATWRKVTGPNNPDANGGGPAVVSLARSGGLLNVLWSQQKLVLNTQVSANGKTVSAPHAVYEYEGVAGDGPKLLAAPAGLLAFFVGIDVGPLDGLVAVAGSTDGVSWSAPTAASNSSTVGRLRPRAPLGGTLWTNGTPMSIWGGFNGEAGYHVGTGTDDPNVRFYDGDAARCCIGEANAATDSRTGVVAIGYTDPDGRQVVKFVQPAAGFPPGPRINIPGGEAAENGPGPLAMTGRSGGAPGIFVAYLRGTNPFSSSPMIWRIGDQGPLRLTRRDGRFPGVAMGVNGRLWAFWAQGLTTGQTRRIFAARSNKEATRFGETVLVKPPRGTGDGNVLGLEGEGTASGGTLDLVAALALPNDGTGNYITRVLPGITLKVRKLDNGDIQFKTLDAGDKLATKIKFAGNTKQTGPDGKVTFSAPKPGKYTAKATKNGYTPAKKRVKVPQQN
jgi:hypothetical protein